jgi:microcystin degradation protein MlrC
VVLAAGATRIVVTSNAPAAIGPRFFTDVDLRPRDHDVCVVKSWLAFRMEFFWQNRMSLWARTRGITDIDAMRTLTYDGPVWPFHEVADWRPRDRARRGAL